MNFKILNEQLENLLEWIHLDNTEKMENLRKYSPFIEEELTRRNIDYEKTFHELEGWNGHFESNIYDEFNLKNLTFHLNFKIKDMRKKNSDYTICISYQRENSKRLDFGPIQEKDDNSIKNLIIRFLDFIENSINVKDNYLVAVVDDGDGDRYRLSFHKKFKTLEDIKKAFGQAYDYIIKNEVKNRIWEPNLGSNCYWGPENILKLGPMYYDGEEGLKSREDFINYNLNYINDISSETSICIYNKGTGEVVAGVKSAIHKD